MKKTNLSLLLALLAALVTACEPQVAQQAAQASGPRAWIDAPLDGSSLPLAAYEVVYHGAHAAGVALLELSVNGAVVASSPSADASQTLVAVRYHWEPSLAGNYTLQARAQDQSGTWGAPASALVTVGEGIETEAPPEEEPTPTPEAATDTPVPPASTSVPPTLTPAPPTAAPPTPVPPTPVPPTPALSADMESDTNRPGMDYKDFGLSAPDPNLCRSACFGEAQCMAYTYVKPATQGAPAHCWLKSAAPPPVPDTCCVSGAKPVTPTPKPHQAPTITTVDHSLDVFYTNSACGRKDNLFLFQVTDPSGVASVTFYYRLKSTTTGATSSWTSVAMKPYGVNWLWTITDASTEIVGVTAATAYTMEYYAIATNAHGLTTQSATYADVTLQASCVK